jgi:hypothetical protein
MPNKILRIFFSGISTLSPGPPKGKAKPPKKSFVLMAANRRPRKNDWNATVPKHSAYIFVPLANLAEPVPPPKGKPVIDEKLGRCHVYLIDHARVVLDRKPVQGIRYHIEKGKDLAERPGANNVASANDIRWLADFREIVPEHSGVRASLNPAAKSVGKEVSVVVELTGGTWKANFPCETVQPKTFKDAEGKIVKGINRVLANEFFIEIPFPANVERVKLRLKPLRANTPPAGLGPGNELTLKWNGPDALEVRMGNDTEGEARVVTSTKRCDARFFRGKYGEPVVVPRDDDFFLHYQIIDVPDGVGPLPQNGPQQTHFDGCVPGAGG